ncbi:amidohydrolase family protein [Sphingopyxis macrogoltabida]|uniref:Metal-dependent hydrolase n=1 Tax=Sphingopyxis macrogoltabida TaxID=33050 RepID=A0AAC9FHK6_SPHMC|nr:amidohydrolase family protein [Sphingopyxis macrogoltabida]ALJ16376.1 metal-dependent hydrolase [Sphingopyxis macrogoltabida]AMU92610.1 metal-dependent hydrolase [Sphingopyxis macrogoltabida]
MTKENADVVFDADQHYYEPVDAFTRHLPKGWGPRTVQRADVGGKVRLLVAGKINMTVNNPTFDPIVKPGAMTEYFRGNPQKKTLDQCLAEREPIPASYRDPVARLKIMDAQDVKYVWMLPTLGMAYEEGMQEDPVAAAVAFHAFNEWLLDDWGFVHSGRIFSSPYLAMGDVDAAVREVDWMLEKGAKVIVVRPSAVYTKDGWKSPGNPMFDPIWARIEEAGVVLVPHVAEVGGFGLDRYAPYDPNIIGEGASPLQASVGHERPIMNYLAALVCDRLFERFPNLHIASIENGAEFLPGLLKGLHRASFLIPDYFKGDPVEMFKRNVWVAPFWEDNIDEAIELIGADRVLFGSDWPHPEGMLNPRDFEHEIGPDNLPSVNRKIMFENAAYLTGIG